MTKKRKAGTKKKPTRGSDTERPDAETIAARLKIAPPPSIGMNIEGRSSRERWIENGAEFDLNLAMHGQAAPSALSHLLSACLRLRGLNDTDDPRRKVAEGERDETLVLLNAATKKHTRSFLEKRAMAMAQDIDRGLLDWPNSPGEFMDALLGQPGKPSTATPADTGSVPPDLRIKHPVQNAILEALDGRALRTDDLAKAVGCDRRRLFRRNGIKELKAAGEVANHEVIGYYRPDRPPPEVADSMPPK